MAGRKSDFTLTRVDDLFTTQAQREEERLSKIRDIPLELIDDFPDHPFKVRDDEDMQQLVESIKERGVITPATVRQKEDGRYELISGHRRKRASELAGFDTLRCEVVDLNRDEATILMVESNFQRSQILPSEKAYAYKMRLEAMKRQAGRPAKNNSPVGNNLEFAKSSDELADKTGESKNQIYRYVRLTNLVPELLEFVDEGRIKMRPAVELSYLDEDSQRDVVDEIDLFECAIDLLSYATLMKLEGKNWRQLNLVSLAGVYSPKQNIGDSKVPVTVRDLLEKDKSIKRIILHLDNDIAGRKATKALQTILSDKYEVVDDPPKCGKDVNDFLCIKLGIFKKHERSFER